MTDEQGRVLLFIYIYIDSELTDVVWLCYTVASYVLYGEA
jgi:hypothetical protein